jgi:general secretion pathway protein F
VSMQFLVKILQHDAGVGIALFDATDAADAARLAAARGLAVLSVQRPPLLQRLRGSRGSAFPLLLFSRELLSLLESGITIVEAIETLTEKETRADVRQVLQRIVTGMREGRPFSATLEDEPRVFVPLYVATVRASERTSGLGEALGRYIDYATQLELLRGRLVSAAIYPVLLVVVSTLVILFLMGYVVPRFSHIYEDMGGELPLMSRLLLHWGQAVEQHGGALLGVVMVAGVVLVRGGAQFLRGALVRQLWRLPAVGERMRVYQLARLYRTLGMLLRGGIAIVPALEMVKGMLQPEMQLRLAGATRAVREGQSISLAFESKGLTTAVAVRMLRVGERAGNMGEMMERAAAFHDEEMARWAEWATRLIGPVMMLLMGLLIGGIVILMYLPIFQLADNIQ